MTSGISWSLRATSCMFVGCHRWSCVICSANCSHCERHWHSNRFSAKWGLFTRIAGLFTAYHQHM